MSIAIYVISVILVFVFSGLPHSRGGDNLSYDVRVAKFLKSCRAIIKLSWKSVNIRFYRERWKAVEEIERQELRAMSLEERWQKLNAIIRFAREMPGKGAGKMRKNMELFWRWAKMKAQLC